MQLEYSEANKAGKLNIAAEIIAAAALGATALMAFFSMFGLTWTPDDYSGSPVDGLVRVWNSVADKLGSTNYYILDKFQGSMYDGTNGTGYGLFAAIILVILIVISFFIIKSRLRPLLLLFVVPLVICMAGLGISPGALQGAAFGGALIFALSVMNVKGRIKPSFFLVPLISVTLAVAGASALDYAFNMDRPDFVEDAASKVDERIDKMRFGENALPDGNIGSMTGKTLKARRGSIDDVKDALNAKAVEDEKDIALKVTMETPVSTYLRGFVGTVFDENRWQELSSQDFYSKRDEVYWLNRQGFDGLTQIAQAAKLGGSKEKESKVTVEVVDARKRVAYTPYELTCDGVSKGSEIELPGEFKNYGGSFLGNKGLLGSPEYSYKMAGEQISRWTDAVGELFTADKSEETDSYFLNESNYNVSVYEDYLDIPDSLVTAISGEIGSPGDIKTNHAGYKETIEKIRKYLSDNYIYSETFEKPGKGSDLIRKFIDDKRGSDVHFASLATMMFRYFGIPARYIEGYLISPANVEGAEEGAELPVSKAANHAWTEIYVDGFGWVPMEMSLEYEGIMKEADMTKGLDNFDYDTKNQNRQRDKKQDEDEDSEEEQSGFLSLFMRIMTIVLIVLASLVLLALMILIGIRIAKWIGWRLAFRDKDPKKGVRAIYQYGNEKKYEFSDRADEIGMRASYSTRDVTEKDRVSMRGELKDAKERTIEIRRKEKEQKK